MSDLETGLKALADSAEAYREAEKYYTGTIEEYFASDKIGKYLGKVGSSFKLNFSSIPVDARADRSQVASVNVPGSDTLTKILVEKIWDENNLDEDLDEFRRKALYFGDYYVVVQLDDEDEDDLHVEVHGNSPLVMRAVYSRENSRKVKFYIKTWEADESTTAQPVIRVNLYYRDRVEQYVSTKKSPKVEADFEPYIPDAEPGDIPDEDAHHIETDDWCVFHLRQLSKPYGTPVHKRGWGAQDAINKINITHMSTIESLGFPQRWALIDSSDEDTDDGDWVEYETSEPGDPNVPRTTGDFQTKRSKLKSGPGETWWLDNVSSVGQFEAAGHEPFIEPLKFQVRALARLTGTPADDFDLEGGTPISGESRRRAERPFTASIRSIEAAHGAVIERFLVYAMSLLGNPVEAVEVRWAPQDMASDKSDWETMGLKLESGIPVRTVLAEAGYSVEDIEAFYPKDAPALSISQIAKLATALASFGQAQTLGSITVEDIRAAIPEFFAGSDKPEPLDRAPAAEPEA
jgi:hypothetical protein